MSVVTNLIVNVGWATDPEIDRMQAWLKKHCRGTMTWIDPRGTGGPKCFEASLMIGAFNHFPLDEFKEVMPTFSWRFPDNVQVIFKRDQDERFSVWNLTPAAVI